MRAIVKPNLHRFRTQDGARLAIRHYAPTAPNGQAAIVLVHGLLSSADIFDVPGVEDLSLARHLAGQGFDVFTYDQRGAGESVAPNMEFGLEDHAFIDLPAVLQHAGELLPDVPPTTFVLGGHSLGGVIIYLQQMATRRREGAFGPAVGRVFCLASPAAFNPEWSPWNLIERQGLDLVPQLDRNGTGRISRDAFVAGQALLEWPLLGRLLRPWMISVAIRCGIALPWLAGALRMAPLPTYLYGRDDFSNRTFAKLLASRALDSCSAKLLSELVGATLDGGRLTVGHGSGRFVLPDDLGLLNGIGLLTVTSHEDAFVPVESVAAVHAGVGSGRHVVTDEELGIPSGHVGYLFRSDLAEEVHRMVTDFAR